jgi:hypothetical protein
MSQFFISVDSTSRYRVATFDLPFSSVVLSFDDALEKIVTVSVVCFIFTVCVCVFWCCCGGVLSCHGGLGAG